VTDAIELAVQRDDVADVDADLLLLKYARRFYGADEVIMTRLTRAGLTREAAVDPVEGEFVAVDSEGHIGPARVLFVGVPPLRDFRYKQMRSFAARALAIVDEQDWPARTLATTVHGAGYGLDIEESLHAMVAGFQQAIARGLAPTLERIVFVERNARRFDLLRSALNEFPRIPRPSNKSSSVPVLPTNAPAEVEKKRLIFVAMPFAQEFDDVYQFGIYSTARRLGFVCERVDESYYAGNIVDRIREGIRNADFVIADLTDERPNVYLEVGFAWGLGRPVILIARDGQRLHFDLSHHKCIFYPTIGRLADQLERTIRDLFVDT
jgi:hypothetical protein